MGNSESSQQNFPIAQYQNKGLTNEEILGIRDIFLSLDPEDNQIEVEKFKELYQNSFDKKSIDQLIGDRKKLNFDQYFDIMNVTITDKKRKYGDVQFDSNAKNIQCVLCPAAQQASK